MTDARRLDQDDFGGPDELKAGGVAVATTESQGPDAPPPGWCIFGGNPRVRRRPEARVCEDCGILPAAEPDHNSRWCSSCWDRAVAEFNAQCKGEER